MVDMGQLLIPQVIRRAVDDLYVGKFYTAPKWAILIIAIALFFSVLRFFWRYFFIGTSRLLERNLRQRLYDHTLKMDPGFFRSMKTGDVMALFTNDLQAINMALGMGMVAIADFVIYTSFSIVAMLLISPRLTAMVLLPLPFIGVVMFFLGRLLYKKFREVQDFFGYMTEWLRDILSGIRVVKGYDTRGRLMGRYAKISQDFLRLNLQFAAIDGLFHPAISTLAYLSLAILLLVGGGMTATGDITLGDYVAFSSYIGMMIWPMIALGWFANLVQRGSASYSRIERYLSVKPRVEEEGGTEIKGFNTLRVEGLTVSINGREVLRGVDFHLKAGEFVGITGPTGSGKSVFLETLVKFYLPSSGKVEINGVDYADISTSSLRRVILLVPQESFVFSMTVEENLRMANPDADREAMWWALEMSGLADDIRKMPDGLKTVIGERGVGLSGGQRQRLALARAFLSEASVVLLDESLSALDSITEERVVSKLRELDKTVVLVSHRLVSISKTDRIYVFLRGRVVEEGRHEELLKFGEVYPILWNAQLSSLHLTG